MLRPSSLRASSKRTRLCHWQLQARNVSTPSRVSRTQSFSPSHTVTSSVEAEHLSKTLPSYGSTTPMRQPPSHIPSGKQKLSFSERMVLRQASLENPSSQLPHGGPSNFVQQITKTRDPPMIEIVQSSIQKTTRFPHRRPNQPYSRAPPGTKENSPRQLDRESQERFARKVQNLKDKVAAQRLADRASLKERGTTLPGTSRDHVNAHLSRPSSQPFVIRPNNSGPSRRSFREFLPSHDSSRGSPEIWTSPSGKMGPKRRKKKFNRDREEEFERGYISRIATKEDEAYKEFDELEGQTEDNANAKGDPEVVRQGMLYQLVHNLEFSDLDALFGGKLLGSKLAHSPVKNSPPDQSTPMSKEMQAVSEDDSSEQLSLSFESFRTELGDELGNQPSIGEPGSSTLTTGLVDAPPPAEAHDAAITSSSSISLPTLSPRAYQTLLKEIGGNYSAYVSEAGRDLEKANPLNHAGFALSRQRDIKLWRRRFAQGIVSKAAQK